MSNPYTKIQNSVIMPRGDNYNKKEKILPWTSQSYLSIVAVAKPRMTILNSLILSCQSLPIKLLSFQLIRDTQLRFCLSPDPLLSRAEQHQPRRSWFGTCHPSLQILMPRAIIGWGGEVCGRFQSMNSALQAPCISLQPSPERGIHPPALSLKLSLK